MSIITKSLISALVNIYISAMPEVSTIDLEREPLLTSAIELIPELKTRMGAPKLVLSLKSQ